MPAQFQSPQSSEFVNPMQAPQWNLTLQQFPGATIFHTAQWAQVLAEAYGYTPHYLLSRQGDRTGVLPLMEVRSALTGNRAVCLPFTDECSPLLSEGKSAADLIGSAREVALQKHWDYVELRSDLAQGFDGAQLSQEFFVHHLALEASDAQQVKKLRGSTMRNIRKSERDGVVVNHLDSTDAMHAFYDLHCLTRRRHGLPPQPRRFFDLIHQLIIQPGLGFVTSARFQNKWIAGAVYFQFGSSAIYKFGASDPAYQHLRANNLVMWSAIQRLQQKGIRELSFGRTDIDDEGLLQFKRGWGAVESTLRYYRVLTGSKASRTPSTARQGYALTRRIAEHLPLPVLRWIGGVIYRHMG